MKSAKNTIALRCADENTSCKIRFKNKPLKIVELRETEERRGWRERGARVGTMWSTYMKGCDKEHGFKVQTIGKHSSPSRTWKTGTLPEDQTSCRYDWPRTNFDSSHARLEIHKSCPSKSSSPRGGRETVRSVGDGMSSRF